MTVTYSRANGLTGIAESACQYAPVGQNWTKVWMWLATLVRPDLSTCLQGIMLHNDICSHGGKRRFIRGSPTLRHRDKGSYYTIVSDKSQYLGDVISIWTLFVREVALLAITSNIYEFISLYCMQIVQIYSEVKDVMEV